VNGDVFAAARYWKDNNGFRYDLELFKDSFQHSDEIKFASFFVGNGLSPDLTQALLSAVHHDKALDIARTMDKIRANLTSEDMFYYDLVQEEWRTFSGSKRKRH
jgi:hypothetical protein